MSSICFEWDERKNRENMRKHRVSFEEARTVFLDEQAIRYFDPDHSADEDRFIMLGLSYQLRVLVVCHCYRTSETTIRIISARKADQQERTAYRR
ncbi:MAG: BrnT family toxin [Deltaproteobacteria bacterium]|nr:BrnT family toxin [Deltaproteobacteria bacterium]